MKRFALTLAAAFAALSPLARGQALVFNPVTSPVGLYDNFGGSLGEFFTVNAGYTVSVASVGVLDEGSDGLAGTVNVALFYNSGVNAGTIVSGTSAVFSGSGASGDTTESTSLVGNSLIPSDTGNGSDAARFRVASLSSPVTLAAGDYAIVAWGFGTDNYINGNIGSDAHGPTATFDDLGGAMTYEYSAYEPTGPAGELPLTSSNPNAFLAGTFTGTSAIPEPSTYAAIFGVLALGAVAVRKRLTKE